MSGNPVQIVQRTSARVEATAVIILLWSWAGSY